MESIKGRESSYPYDAVIVLGGGLNQLQNGRFYPTDFRHGDEFGMLGAGIRMQAAVDLYLGRQARNFVFSTGVTAKNREKWGEYVLPESEVYAEKFRRVLGALKSGKDASRFNGFEDPKVTLESRSVNTMTNIQEVLRLISDMCWSRVAIVSSDYHIPRVQALYTQAFAQHPELAAEIEFLSAEAVVQRAHPGRFEKVIARAYHDVEARRRRENERNGLGDIRAGRYAVGEFQLEKRRIE